MEWTREGLHWRTEDTTIFPKYEDVYLVGYSWVRSGVFSDTTFETAEEAKQDLEKKDEEVNGSTIVNPCLNG